MGYLVSRHVSAGLPTLTLRLAGNFIRQRQRTFPIGPCVGSTRTGSLASHTTYSLGVPILRIDFQMVADLGKEDTSNPGSANVFDLYLSSFPVLTVFSS